MTSPLKDGTLSAGFDQAMRDPKVSVAERCIAAYHKAQSRFKARDRKGSAPMFDDAAAVVVWSEQGDR